MSPDTHRHQQETWPNRAIAVASVVLVVVTSIYTWSAYRQTNLTHEILNDTIKGRKEGRRAWLGYASYTLRTCAHPGAAWEARGPRQAGEPFQIRCRIRNTGQTPAYNVKLGIIEPQLVEKGEIPPLPVEERTYGGRLLIFPGDPHWDHSSDFLSLSEQQFTEYASLQKELFFWAELYYCDMAGHRHWTKVGIAHAFGDNQVYGRTALVSPGDGEADHPECQVPWKDGPPP